MNGQITDNNIGTNRMMFHRVGRLVLKMIVILFLLTINGCHSYMYEKLADNVDWSIDSVGTAFDVNFSPSSSNDFQMKNMRFLTKSHIERFTFEESENIPKRLYKVNSPSTNYTMIFENHEFFVTIHLNNNSEFILWSTVSGNRLNKIVIDSRVLTYICTNVVGENSVQLYLLTDDLNLKRIDLASGLVVFTYKLPFLTNSLNEKSFKLQASMVNYYSKIFLYYLQNNQVMVADVSIITGEPTTRMLNSEPIIHQSDIDLSNHCYISTHGLSCFVPNDKHSKPYIFTINRDNFQHQLHLDEPHTFIPQFHSNSILELYSDVDNTIRYIFYVDGIIANITNQIPKSHLTNTKVIVMQSVDMMSTQHIYLGFASLLNDANSITTRTRVVIYELQFEDNRIEFFPVYETLLKKHHHISSDYNLHVMKYIVTFENNAYNLYVLCQCFDKDQNQLLELFHNGVLYWSSESNLGEITNILPIEVMEQRKVNEDENLAYQSNSFLSRLFYRFKIFYTALVKFVIHFGTHFGLKRKFTVYKNHRHSTILLVTTSKSYIYGVYSKYGEVLWCRKLINFKPFVDDSSKKHSLPIYLISKAEVRGGRYRSSVAAVVGKGVDAGECQTVVWAFDPLTGNFIDNTQLANPVDTKHFKPLSISTQLGRYYTLVGDINNCKLYNIFPFENTLVFATNSYDDTIVFPSRPKLETKFNKLMFDVVYKENQSIVGSALSINNHFEFLKIKRWSISIPVDASNVKIYSSTSEYYTDKTKMMFDNRAYRPYNLENVIVVSYMGLNPSVDNSTDTSYVLNVMFIDSRTGKVLKLYVKRNILDPNTVVVNLVSNVCTIISTNYRSKLSTVSVVGFYTDIEAITSSDENLLVLVETYFLGKYKIDAAAATTTNFGFSHKSLILSSYDDRLWAVSFKLLDPRRNYKSNITDSALGVVDFFPQIEQNPLDIVNKNDLLLNVSNLVTFPSHLESTSIVCAASLNGLYCSHLVGLHGVPFDILSVNFDRYFVVIFIVGLFIAVWFSRNFNRKKILYNQWL